MYKIIVAAVLILGTLQLNAQQTTGNQPDISKFLKFTNVNYDMGKIAYGKSIEFTVDIQNISNSPIILENIMVGCGCTTPKFTKGQSIAPGAHAAVILGFNGSAVGNFSKSATIFFSGGLTKNVTFFGVGVQ